MVNLDDIFEDMQMIREAWDEVSEASRRTNTLAAWKARKAYYRQKETDEKNQRAANVAAAHGRKGLAQSYANEIPVSRHGISTTDPTHQKILNNSPNADRTAVSGDKQFFQSTQYGGFHHRKGEAKSTAYRKGQYQRLRKGAIGTKALYAIHAHESFEDIYNNIL